MDLRIGILTVSDSVSAGTNEDRGGPAIRNALDHSDWHVAVATVVPDDRNEIESVLRQWSDEERLDIIFTT